MDDDPLKDLREEEESEGKKQTDKEEEQSGFSIEGIFRMKEIDDEEKRLSKEVSTVD